MTEGKLEKRKILITMSILFVAVAVIILLIFFAGKKTYVVHFDPNGGTVVTGDLEQTVVQGQSATPPVVVKDGAYLRAWSSSYDRITHDMTIKAIWDYNTTNGIVYAAASNQNFTEITGTYSMISGEVYIGAFYGDKKVLGIKEGSFADRPGITKIYLPEGILVIEKDAFKDCTGLTEIVIPKSVLRIDEGAFSGCDNLIITTLIPKDEKPEYWADGWEGSAEVVWYGEEERSLTDGLE